MLLLFFNKEIEIFRKEYRSGHFEPLFNHEHPEKKTLETQNWLKDELYYIKKLGDTWRVSSETSISKRKFLLKSATNGDAFWKIGTFLDEKSSKDRYWKMGTVSRKLRHWAPCKLIKVQVIKFYEILLILELEMSQNL